MDDQNLRIFGYNNPNPSSGQKEYGYEVCITIGDSTVNENDLVKTKILEGGIYAVSGIKRKNENFGNEIVIAWQRFQNWLRDSKYAYGGHQWLEEHLGFDQDFNHIGGIDLYMPIVEKGNIDMTCCIIVCGDKNIDGTNEFLVESCSAATQNILLAAHGLGLGGTWCGILKTCGSYDCIREFFGLPEKIVPIAVIALGYPDEEKISEPRYDDTKVHWGRW